MKKKFESPAIETCEFVVAARLNASGIGTAHDAGVGSPKKQESNCGLTASMGTRACGNPTANLSSVGNSAC